MTVKNDVRQLHVIRAAQKLKEITNNEDDALLSWSTRLIIVMGLKALLRLGAARWGVGLLDSYPITMTDLCGFIGDIRDVPHYGEVNEVDESIFVSELTQVIDELCFKRKYNEPRLGDTDRLVQVIQDYCYKA